MTRRMIRLARDDRAIAAIAVPAFAALVAEPLMLVADTAIVGRLGTVSLAGLASASAVLTTVVGLCIFLAYGTTASVARRQGAGDHAGAVGDGVTGIWLALGLGVVLGTVVIAAAAPLADALSSSAAASGAATEYLRISAGAVPAMLVVLAATGALRGQLDLRTPLLVVVVANVVNVVLELTLVFGAGLGIRGAALGTLCAQWLAAAWLAGRVLLEARRVDADLRPHPREVLGALRDGVPLLVRTVTLRASLLIATAVAARLGDAALAAHQIAATIVSLLAFMLDAIAIAGQTLTGTSLGAGDTVRTRELLDRMLRWGVASGTIAAVALLAAHDLVPRLFDADRAVSHALLPALVVVAVIQPLSGVVFVLDGVLIGAGDGTYLAWAGLVVLAVYAPLAIIVGVVHASLSWLWAAYAGFIVARLVTLWLRQRRDSWMTLGSPSR